MKSRFFALAVAMLGHTWLAAPSSAATPAHFWSRQINGPDNDGIYSIAVVPGSGDVVTTGYFNGTVNFGTGDLTTTDNSTDGFVARYNSRGEIKWVKRFGYFNADAGVGVAVDASGFIYLLGRFSNSVNLGGSDLYSNGGTDLFVAKLDPNGALVWNYSYGGTGEDGPLSLTLDASNNVIVSGSFTGTTNLGGGPVPAASTNAFIVKYNNAGAWQWNVFGTGTGVCYTVTTDAASNVYGTGYFSTSLTFSPNPALISDGGFDAFFVKYNSAGVLQWSQRRGGTLDDLGVKIVSDSAGNIVAAGGFNGTASFGGSNLVSAGSYDIYLAKYNTSGAHQWSFRYGGGTTDIAQGLTLLSSGSILLTGYCGANTNFGGGVLPNQGGRDIFIAKFSTSGSYSWDRVFGGGDDDLGSCIAADAAGNAYVAGTFEDAVNFGGGPVQADAEDSFFAKYGTADPAIISVTDIGNDQGRSVRIRLSRSAMDDGTAELPIIEYQAFRRILPLPSSLLAKGTMQVPVGTWEYVASVPASNATSYRIVAPTLADSTIENGMYRTKFFVRAATANPSVFFDSPADSGYSRDNLAPEVPSNFAYTAGSLNWNESQAGDFNYFTVYGSNSNSFGSATLVDYTVAPTMDVSASVYSYYFLTATDFSGNEGKPAVVVALTGVGDGPKAYALSVSAYPNPFNPETTVRYTVPSRSHVELVVYDLRGERVATLVNREHEAGAFTTPWNGRNTRGETVGSGVYFARLVTSTGERSYKMVLLK